MKKFIAIGSIALGSFGLIGMGSVSAFAATPTAKATVCTSAGTQLAAQAVKLATDTATGVNTAAALATANTLVATTEGNYITTALKVLNDVDGTPVVTPAVQATDTTAFNTALSSFVSAITGQGSASVADFNAKTAVANDKLLGKVLGDLQSATC
ncbi:MAG: hypothetical protein M3N98_00425 [Actinomycetota bacterium]|nr:hypothetical protein [Actinomycetota bacterium]